MKAGFSRRGLIHGTAAAFSSAMVPRSRAATESGDDIKICLWITNLEEGTLRAVKQLGVDWVGMGGPSSLREYPNSREVWQEADIRSVIERLKEAGLRVGNMMIGGFPSAIYGRPGRDREIENVRQSIRAAGRAGIPVVEYNFYAHRAVEGYYDEPGRGGALLTAFDYDRIKDLQPLPEEGAHGAEELWSRLAYFLKAVVPTAEESRVRLALHPNDPPAPKSRGSDQLMATLDGWKRLIGIVDSPSNGITFDCGVTREIGHDPVEVARYFGSRDRINHMHFRNVRTRVPSLKYTEVFLEDGEVDMLAVMREMVRLKYSRMIYPEHPPLLDVDKRAPHAGISSGRYTGFAYTVGYTKAMLQAARR
jgi:mannonate dehydratase